MKKINGKIQSGKNNANKWLRIFSKVYKDWLGLEIYPGSLNIETGEYFDWHSSDVLSFRRRFSLVPFGGEKDLFMIPCSIVTLPHVQCWLWTTTNCADYRPDSTVVELISSECLRSRLGLFDGAQIEVDYPKEW